MTRNHKAKTDARTRAAETGEAYATARRRSTRTAFGFRALSDQLPQDIGLMQNSVWLVAGPSGCGRSQFGRRLIADYSDQYTEIQVIDLSKDGVDYTDLIGLVPATLTITTSTAAAVEELRRPLPAGSRKLLIFDAYGWDEWSADPSEREQLRMASLELESAVQACVGQATMVFLSQLPRTFRGLLSLETTRLLLGRTPALDTLMMFGSVDNVETLTSTLHARGSGVIRRPGEAAEVFRFQMVDWVRP